MEQEQELWDVIIIGGGPAGLTAAQYTARAGLRAVVIDKSPTAGALGFASRIENYPGMEAPLSGKELLDIFRRQAINFGAKYVEAQVVGVNLSGNVKEVFTMGGAYSGKAVIVATGSMGRKPTIKGEAEFLGKGVSYCAVCDAAFFKGRTVCVIGGSEEALKEAGHLLRNCKEVYLISPLKKLAIGPDHPVLKSPNLKLMEGATVTAILGGEVVERIRIVDSEKREGEIELSGVFVYLHGSKPLIDFLTEAVELSDSDCIVTNRMMETSIPGVFSAGDVTCVEVRQVVVAAANGAVAALSAEKFITHKKRRKYDWGKVG
ncbi:MAG: FAD-dependent oxidoreductase [Nitrospiraceae bacterium]|nr:FAD-dependent oxidoreductase [Nitrospiraceae bacterium]